MKQSYHSLAGKTGWANRTKKQKAEHIEMMNKARIKVMEQNKKDAEEYRKLKLAELDKNAIHRV